MSRRPTAQGGVGSDVAMDAGWDQRDVGGKGNRTSWWVEGPRRPSAIQNRGACPDSFSPAPQVLQRAVLECGVRPPHGLDRVPAGGSPNPNGMVFGDGAWRRW